MYRSILVATAILAIGGTASAQSTMPQADSRAPANAAVKDSHVKTSTMAAKGANSFTKSQAMKRIAKAGYTQVSGLMKDSSGLWQGTAMKGGASVPVALDYKGNVTSK